MIKKKNVLKREGKPQLYKIKQKREKNLAVHYLDQSSIRWKGNRAEVKLDTQ